MTLPPVTSIVALSALCLVFGYWLLLAAASVRSAPPVRLPSQAKHRFVVVVPAHDEESVIGDTVRRLRLLDYPPDMVAVHVAADHCSDDTAAAVRMAGGTVHERDEGARTGKGAALCWLFDRILGDDCDAVVVFDADTRVDSNFLRVMDARLTSGARIIQGQHTIGNPRDGWFPALTWSMFLIDNRYQNLGRSNLGWSAKNMGDSICFHASVLRNFGWEEGLTEDFRLRQRLLLAGVRIEYEPAAVGRGEAPVTWRRAWVQRARWLQGTRVASREFGWRLFEESLKRRNGALLDGALQAYCPSYSTLALITVAAIAAQLVINCVSGPTFGPSVMLAWTTVASLLFLYPFGALALEGAPPRAFLAILLGPVFIAWRTCLVLSLRARRGELTWTRTIHGERREGA